MAGGDDAAETIKQRKANPRRIAARKLCGQRQYRQQRRIDAEVVAKQHAQRPGGAAAREPGQAQQRAGRQRQPPLQQRVQDNQPGPRREFGCQQAAEADGHGEDVFQRAAAAFALHHLADDERRRERQQFLHRVGDHVARKQREGIGGRGIGRRQIEADADGGRPAHRTDRQQRRAAQLAQLSRDHDRKATHAHTSRLLPTRTISAVLAAATTPHTSATCHSGTKKSLSSSVCMADAGLIK